MNQNELFNNFRKIRKEKNISIDKMAKELGIGKYTISEFDKGIRIPKLEILLRLVNMLCTTLGQLMPDYLNSMVLQTKLLINMRRLSHHEANSISEFVKLMYFYLEERRSEDILLYKYDISYLGRNIEMYRNQLYFTKKEVCQRAGLDYRTYLTIENKKSNPTYHNLEKIAAALEITMFELILDSFNAYGYLLRNYFPFLNDLETIREIEYKFIYESVLRLTLQMVNYQVLERETIPAGLHLL